MVNSWLLHRVVFVINQVGDDKPVRSHVSVMTCICADGTFIPPLWMVKGKKPLSFEIGEKMLANTIPGSAVVSTPKAYIDFESWSQWLQHFVRNLPTPPTENEPVLLLLDDHSTRYNWQCIEFALHHHIIIYLLPPHMTSVMQPLDVGIFGPFKVC
jgi:hypothetical protein